MFLISCFRKWLSCDGAAVAVEAGLLFPVMVSILCGVMDTGIGLVTNQKAINASQTVADLLAREEDVTDTELNDAIIAGRLSLQPYDTATYGVDIAGIRFVGETLTPTVEWRDTVNMEENVEIATSAEGLGLENEGVIGVTVHYYYEPFFSAFIVGGLAIEEIAYVRGRNGLFVTRTAGA